MPKNRLFFQRLASYTVRHPSGIIIGCSLFVLLMLGLLAAILLQERRNVVEGAVRNAENLASLVEHDIVRTIELFDLSLQAVADGVQEPGVMRLPLAYRQHLLFDRSATAGRYRGALLYLDAQGRIAIDSSAAAPLQGNFSQRDWFVAQRDNPQAGLYISPPQPPQLRDLDWNIVFSRRVDHADGSFAGVVVGTLQLDYFRHLLAGLMIGPHGSISLIHDSGTIIMRNPENGIQVGRNLRGTPNFERFLAARESRFFGAAALDGERRLYVYRQFHSMPVAISVAAASRDIYAAWTRRAWRIGAFAAFLAAGLLGAAWLLAAEFRYRLKIETELLMLSRTDGLTGLSNRRTLDDALQNEWRRTQRTGQALSLLFIDIDRFKNFNDRYGHQAGDDALAAVAAAIADTIRRPGDIAARFGGEEFVVLLPDTALDGAAAVAAQIHRAVRALHIAHLSSEHAIVTVSIGAACCRAGDQSDVPTLLKQADEALYAAKAGGRNQTVCAPDG